MITLKAEFHPDYYQLTWGLIHFRIPMKDPIFQILYDAGLMNQYLTIKSYDHLDNYFSNLKALLKVPS